MSIPNQGRSRSLSHRIRGRATRIIDALSTPEPSGMIGSTGRYRIAPGSRLAYARMDNANLWEAELAHSDLFRARLNGANACFANLSGANLSEASMVGVYLYNTNLSNADLRGANLFGAFMGSTILINAIWNDSTVWPKDFNPLHDTKGIWIVPQVMYGPMVPR